MSLVPGSRFPSYPHQGPEYYPPKHMGAVHVSVQVYVNSTPSVVVNDFDDYGSLFSVNLAGGSVAGSAVANSNVTVGGQYSYGASVAAGATLGAITFTGSPYVANFYFSAQVNIVDTADTVAEQIFLASATSSAGYALQGYVGAAAGASEALSGIVNSYIAVPANFGSQTHSIAINRIATTANCTIYLTYLSIYVLDYIPGPGTVGESW